MSEREKRSDRSDEAGEPSRHPSYDPSGEAAGSSTGLPGRDFAGEEFADAEAEQARGRRESMASRDNTALGPHDQGSGDRSGRREGSGEGIHTDEPR